MNTYMCIYISGGARGASGRVGAQLKYIKYP